MVLHWFSVISSKTLPYFSFQCKPSSGRKRGICWCVDKYGIQLPGIDYTGGHFQCKDLESTNNEWNPEKKTTFFPPSKPTLSYPSPTTWPGAHASSLNHTCALRPLLTSRSSTQGENWKEQKKKKNWPRTQLHIRRKHAKDLLDPFSWLCLLGLLCEPGYVKRNVCRTDFDCLFCVISN